ncbi:MAG: 16S rRNA (adenine(1518)-N(6)/adenine(1519)-N(6))-dimethyltransferase RsmA [Patescibacteria group bacterium]|nr:16S rRNA (adenine(1518)-N(6)/adenine(1519)-N(6))-dimethyltransferase RsmA [Patescibacteria group bacterium]MCL5262154.1 16S rRNA (adenine(1518)-N(6)/adenine(1519)-N(6))-dimethyltransferase RsmA [Patescibacteria group bacterium]
MRRLGQHFLKNETVLERIAGVLDISPDDVLIEIGPGHGELTKHLLYKNPRKLIAIERDPKLAARLMPLSPEKLEVVEADALKSLPAIVENIGYGYKLCGNIPYYITGHLFRLIENLPRKPMISVFTIQKEVAERASAKPPEMNLLAGSIAFWAEPQIVLSIPRKDFSPEPKVDSAVILLKTKQIDRSEAERQNYYAFIKTLFKQPRKTILNNLSALKINKGEIQSRLEKQGIDPSIRGQELSFDQIIELSRVFAG